MATTFVRDIMRKRVLTIDAGITVLDAAKMMDDASSGAFVVIKNGLAIGIITEHNIVKRIVAKEKSLQTSRKPCHIIL
jgi:predicted transcriptional regulator